MSVFYKGRGTPEMYDDLMDFMNYVFGFDGDGRDFKKLLPKCYNREYDPCCNNYVVTENGKLRAAIGAYDADLSVNGEILKTRGIGNVAVHPYFRSMGYMKDCMHMALRDMIEDGVDLSLLGGQRQRYQHFGFDHAGAEYGVSVDRGNLRRAFEGVPLPEIELRDVGEEDTELIDRMYALHSARAYRMIRSREAFFDIARSWRSNVTAILRDGEFRGYFTGELNELTLTDPADLADVVRNYVKQRGDLHLHVPGWETETVEALLAFGGGISYGNSEMFNILNYRHVTEVLLKFKASREILGDGELTLLIHGFAGDERFRIAVKDNEVTVENTGAEADLELGHLEAVRFTAGIFSGKWQALPLPVRSWFPLPLYTDPADHV